MLLLALALLADGPPASDAGAADATYRVLVEECEPCRLEDFAAEEKGTRDCGAFHAPQLSPDVARCVGRAVQRRRSFHARFEYADLNGEVATQAFGQASDGGKWFHQLTQDDGSGEACRAIISSRACASFSVPAPDEKPYVQCHSEPGWSETLCSQAWLSRTSLTEPLPVEALRCGSQEGGIYGDCDADAGADFQPNARGPNLICIRKRSGLRCGPERAAPREASEDPPMPLPRCLRPDAGPPHCLGAPYDEALDRLR